MRFIWLTICVINLYAVGIEGQKAPKFEVDSWVQINGKNHLEIEDFRGKVLYLYGFQAWCPGCHSHGFPTLKKLSMYYKDDKEVAFVAVQTVFEGYYFNTKNAAKKIIKKYNLTMPVAHSGVNHKRSQFMINYRTGGTPWIIIVDKQGVVQFNGFSRPTEDLILLIDDLKKE